MDTKIQNLIDSGNAKMEAARQAEENARRERADAEQRERAAEWDCVKRLAASQLPPEIIPYLQFDHPEDSPARWFHVKIAVPELAPVRWLFSMTHSSYQPANRYCAYIKDNPFRLPRVDKSIDDDEEWSAEYIWMDYPEEAHDLDLALARAAQLAQEFNELERECAEHNADRQRRKEETARQEKEAREQQRAALDRTDETEQANGEPEAVTTPEPTASEKLLYALEEFLREKIPQYVY